MFKDVLLQRLAAMQAGFLLIIVVLAACCKKRTDAIWGLITALPIAICYAICWFFIYRKYSREKQRGDTNEDI